MKRNQETPLARILVFPNGDYQTPQSMRPVPVNGSRLIIVNSSEEDKQFNRLVAKAGRELSHPNFEVNAFTVGDSSNMPPGSDAKYPVVYAVQFYHLEEPPRVSSH